MSMNSPPRHGLRRRGILAFVGVMLLLVLSGPWLARCLGGMLIENDQFAAADAAVVELSACPDMSLISHAAGLVRQGRVRTVLLVAYEQSPRLSAAGVRLPKRYHEVLRMYASDAGLEPQEIEVLPVQVIDPVTLNVGRQVAAVASERRFGSIVVITQPFHSRRSALAYRASAAPGVVVHSSPPLRYLNQTTWWRTKDGVVAVAAETIKLVYYKVWVL